jgi:hypothetical protein
MSSPPSQASAAVAVEPSSCCRRRFSAAPSCSPRLHRAHLATAKLPPSEFRFAFAETLMEHNYYVHLYLVLSILFNYYVYLHVTQISGME